MPPDAIVLAVCGAIQAVATVVQKAMDGQTPEQRKQMWDWYIADVERLRKFLRLDQASPSTPAKP